MLSEILALNIFAFFVVFARFAGAISILPGFSASYVSIQARTAFTVMLTFVMVPVLQDKLPPLPNSSTGLGLILIGEFTIGFLIGSVARIFISALQTAGTVIAFTSSMANSMIMDPISQQQSAVVSVSLTTMAMVILFVADLHHLMIYVVADSYSLFTPGLLPDTGEMSEMILDTVRNAFKLGIQLAAPFLLVSFSYNVSMGILARLMPKLNVFFVGMPLSIGLAFALLMICIPSILMIFLKHYEETLERFLVP